VGNRRERDDRSSSGGGAEFSLAGLPPGKYEAQLYGDEAQRNRCISSSAQAATPRCGSHFEPSH
jgi:hypothetical protein